MLASAAGTRATRVGFNVHRALSDRRLRLPLTYFVALQMLDVLSTAAGLLSGLRELNPVTADVLHRYGLSGLVIQKVPVLIAAVLATALLPRRLAIAAAKIACAVMIVVLAGNVALVVSGGS
jgi:hypothetical protein